MVEATTNAELSHHSILNQENILSSLLNLRNIYKKERDKTNTLLELINKMNAELEKQKQVSSKCMANLQHPYLYILYSYLNSLDLVNICLSYLQEKFCHVCFNFYWASKCLNLECNLFDKDKVRMPG